MPEDQSRVIHQFLTPRPSQPLTGSGYLPVYQITDCTVCRDDFAGQAGVAMDDIQIVRITRWSRDIELRDSLVVTPRRKSVR
jgi:hypothetical protein